MNVLRDWLVRIPAYLWSGWGAIASLCLFLALWEWAGQLYGMLILPGPLAAFDTLAGLIVSGAAWPELAATARRALAGFALSVAAGSTLGLLAGLSMTAAMISRPLVTLLVGMPRC